MVVSNLSTLGIGRQVDEYIGYEFSMDANVVAAHSILDCAHASMVGTDDRFCDEICFIEPHFSTSVHSLLMIVTRLGLSLVALISLRVTSSAAFVMV